MAGKCFFQSVQPCIFHWETKVDTTSSSPLGLRPTFNFKEFTVPRSAVNSSISLKSPDQNPSTLQVCEPADTSHSNQTWLLVHWDLCVIKRGLYVAPKALKIDSASSKWSISKFISHSLVCSFRAGGLRQMLREEVGLAGLCHRRIPGTGWRPKQLSYNRSLICPGGSFNVCWLMWPSVSFMLPRFCGGTDMTEIVCWF